ncbi:hypothetical protein VZO05_05245 [Aggregatilineales bacterium SYSU G02658]
MNINIFDDPSLVPQPRDKVRIENVTVTPYEDRRRVFIEVRVTAFQERPNLLIAMVDHTGAVVNEASVIATMHTKMEFTMHMRMANPEGNYKLRVELFYETRNPPLDHREVSFIIPATA